MRPPASELAATKPTSVFDVTAKGERRIVSSFAGELAAGAGAVWPDATAVQNAMKATVSLTIGVFLTEVRCVNAEAQGCFIGQGGWE